MAQKEHIKIFDTTLRDGEQSPGATMSFEQKIEIAHLLEEAGVDIIEAGFPIASTGDFEAVQAIARQSERAVICGLARAQIPDINRAWEAIKDAPNPRIHTFIGTSPLHRDITRMSKDEMLDCIVRTVSHARNLCKDVQWSPMDATRTEEEYLFQVIEAAIGAGATTINIPDTVGYALPHESQALLQKLQSVSGAQNVTFATHCHDDLGLAVANSLAAAAGGARQIECTINGLGERAGNAALEEVVMAIRVRGADLPYDTKVDSRKLTHLSHVVSTASGFAVQNNKAVVGKNAFAHESGIHQDGMLKNSETFEIMRPEDVGLKATNLVMGKHSGRAALRARLKDLGIEVGDNQLKDIFVRFKDLADRKKEVFDDDLRALAREDGSKGASDALRLLDIEVVSNFSGQAQAKLLLGFDGKKHHVQESGDGPVDAVFKAIKRVCPHGARLEIFDVASVTGGTDAQADVTVRLSLDGKSFTGTAAHTDTIVASALAYVRAVNKMVS